MFTTDNVENYNYNNEKLWSLQREEIGLVMWDKEPYNEANMNPKKVHIASIMGTTEPVPDRPVTSYENLDTSIFVNDTKCKPVVSPTITTQNYITIYHYDNDYFKHRWLKHLAPMKIEIRNNDIDDMYITDKLDKSFCFNCVTEHPACNPIHSCR